MSDDTIHAASEYFIVYVEGKRNPDGDIHWCDFKVRSKEHWEESLCSGFVKWDGCSEWVFNPVNIDKAEEGIHFCARTEVIELVNLVYDTCKRLMGRIDNED